MIQPCYTGMVYIGSITKAEVSYIVTRDLCTQKWEWHFQKILPDPFKLGEPILDQSHEVLIWQQSSGVGALASFSESLEYAPGGVDFLTDQLSVKVDNKPLAPGLYRPDLTHPDTTEDGIRWGISLIFNGPSSYLTRFEITDRP